LKVYTVDRYPVNYAAVQTNLGSAYMGLAELHNKEDCLSNAISAYKSSLGVYTVDKYPAEFAKAHKNIGNACKSLSESSVKRTT